MNRQKGGIKTSGKTRRYDCCITVNTCVREENVISKLPWREGKHKCGVADWDSQLRSTDVHFHFNWPCVLSVSPCWTWCLVLAVNFGASHSLLLPDSVSDASSVWSTVSVPPSLWDCSSADIVYYIDYAVEDRDIIILGKISCSIQMSRCLRNLSQSSFFSLFFLFHSLYLVWSNFYISLVRHVPHITQW